MSHGLVSFVALSRRRWFRDRAVSIAEGRWELADPQNARAYRPNEICLPHEHLAGTLVRATDTNLKSELPARDTYWFEKIRIVRDHECNLAVPAKRIHEEMTREIDVGSLLFGLDDSGRRGPTTLRFNQGHADF